MTTGSGEMSFSFHCKQLLCCLLLLCFTVDAWLAFPSFRAKQRGFPTTHTLHASTVETMHGKWNATQFGSTECWGRRPLVMRGAFDAAALPAWEDIVDLACTDEEEEEPITSRLIQHQPGTLDTYQVDFGPFRPQDLLERLQNNNAEKNNVLASTLVVNDVDRWIPDLSDWMDTQFDFLPRWRRDDAQVSLAATGGGIGPHVDNYDVFLIQALGSREWEVGLQEISVQDEFSNLVEASQVRILNMTTLPNETVKLQLQAGDCLYLPPRIMHSGISASSDCMTLSVGCRTPSASDLLSRMAESIATSTAASAVERYTDTNLLQTTDKSISSSVKDKMKQLVLQAVEDLVEDEAAWDALVGRLITEPNRPMIDYPVPLSDMNPEWKQELGIWADADATLESVVVNGNGVLRRAEGVSFAWSAISSSARYRLYALGRAFEVEEDAPSTASLLCRIANGPPLDQNAIAELDVQLSPSIRKFLLELIEEGFLYGDEEAR